MDEAGCGVKQRISGSSRARMRNGIANLMPVRNNNLWNLVAFLLNASGRDNEFTECAWAQSSPVSSDGLRGNADSMSAQCVVMPLQIRSAVGDATHAWAESTCQRSCNIKESSSTPRLQDWLAISRVSVVYDNPIATRRRCGHMEAQRLPAAKVPARHRRHPLLWHAQTPSCLH